LSRICPAFRPCYLQPRPGFLARVKPPRRSHLRSAEASRAQDLKGRYCLPTLSVRPCRSVESWWGPSRPRFAAALCGRRVAPRLGILRESGMSTKSWIVHTSIFHLELVACQVPYPGNPSEALQAEKKCSVVGIARIWISRFRDRRRRAWGNRRIGGVNLINRGVSQVGSVFRRFGRGRHQAIGSVHCCERDVRHLLHRADHRTMYSTYWLPTCGLRLL